MILTELETLVPRDDLGAIVDLAVVAEDARFDAIMLSEHVALGPSANEFGLPKNPREYAAPGNQDPKMLWPSSVVFCMKPSQHTDDIAEVRAVCDSMVSYLPTLEPTGGNP